MLKQFLIIFFILYSYTTNRAFAQVATKSKLSKWVIGIQINTPERMSPLEEQTEKSGSSTWNDEEFLYKGVSANATTKDRSFAASIIANYYLKDDVFIRCKTGVDNIDIKLLPDDYIEATGIYHYYYNAWKKRTDFIIAPGIGGKIVIKKFGFFAGFDVPFTYYGKAQTYNYYQTNDAITGVQISSSEQSGSIFKAYSIGIGNFAGFAFMFKQFSFGGEISYAFLYNKRMSESTFRIVNKDLQTNTVTSVGDVTYNPNISNFDMSKIKGSITLTYSF